MEWWLILVAAIVLVAAFVLYMMYRGYSRVKPKPLEGIPYPEMSHGILGHPEKMLHPLKHELRLEVCDTIRAPAHQLVFLNHSSVFINDSREAARILQEVPSKGELYHLFRLDPHIPDYFSSDGEDFAMRHKAMHAGLMSFFTPEASSHLSQPLVDYLASQVGNTIDIDRTFTLLAMDFVCQVFFRYPLQALQGSAQGQRLYDCVQTFRQVVFKDSLYPNPLARQVTPEEHQQAKDDWRAFVHTLAQHISAQLSSPPADAASSSSSSPFFKLWTEVQPPLQLASEVHSLLQHAHESLAGTLVWCLYALAKHKRVREKVEAAVSAPPAGPAPSVPAYLVCFLNEVLRRYPVGGNFTVRTPTDTSLSLLGGGRVPAGVPVHVHVFSLHNTTRDWVRPMEILPHRWMAPTDGEEEEEDAGLAAPRRGEAAVYDGVGFHPQSVSFLPFSAGPRCCPGRRLAVQALGQTLAAVVARYRLDFRDALGWDDDPGLSLDASILPLNPKVLLMLVSRRRGEDESPSPAST